MGWGGVGSCWDWHAAVIMADIACALTLELLVPMHDLLEGICMGKTDCHPPFSTTLPLLSPVSPYQNPVASNTPTPALNSFLLACQRSQKCVYALPFLTVSFTCVLLIPSLNKTKKKKRSRVRAAIFTKIISGTPTARGLSLSTVQRGLALTGRHHHPANKPPPLRVLSSTLNPEMAHSHTQKKARKQESKEKRKTNVFMMLCPSSMSIGNIHQTFFCIQ